MRNFKILINGNEYLVQIEEIESEGKSGELEKPTEKKETVTSKISQVQKVESRHRSKGEKETVIEAPIPGIVLSIEVKVGDKVEKGENLLVLEAMKMENEIMAPVDGIVTEIKIQQGNSVNAGDILVVIS